MSRGPLLGTLANTVRRVGSVFFDVKVANCLDQSRGVFL